MLRETRKKLKELIFLKAVQLFQERGYENVTVQDITTACGITKELSSITFRKTYYYF